VHHLQAHPVTNPVSRHALHGAGGRVLDDDRQTRRGRARPDGWTWEPRGWAEAGAAPEDTLPSPCDECQQLRDCMPVIELPEGHIIWLCCRCCVADHAPLSWQELNRRWWRGRQAEAAEEHERKVQAAVFGRVE
jgi:hypothetical protein